MKGKNIVIVGLQPWDIEIGSNCKNLALEFAKHNRVLYVNRALDRISSIRNRHDSKVQLRKKSLKGLVSDLEQVAPNLWVQNPRVVLESVNRLPGFLFDFFNKINNRRLARAIISACKRLQFDEVVLFVDNDFFRTYHLPELLKAKFFIYYIRDYLSEQPYFRKHGPRMEKALIKKAGLVAANSGYLASYARRFNPHSYDIGQGCDFSLFKPENNYDMPADLREIPRPLIGYVGALVSYRLDIDLLVDLARRKPEWSIVLVGPEDEAFRNSALHQLKNVYFPGKKEPAELPAYIAHFDVCINPQINNQITLGNYPRKVDEYLSMGKPVVATRTEFMELFKRYVYLCGDLDEYITAIEKALAEDRNDSRKTERRNFALTHTWENSAGILFEKYNHLINLNV